jgi:predicted peptidase
MVYPMYRIILFAATLFISSYSAMAQEKATSLFDRLLFTSQKDTLPYRLLKPVSPGSKESYPLVIFLHGAGERGNDNEVQLIHIKDVFLNEGNRGKYPCYVLAPQCPKKAVGILEQPQPLNMFPFGLFMDQKILLFPL